MSRSKSANKIIKDNDTFSINNISLNHLKSDPIKKFFKKKNQHMKRESKNIENNLNNLNVTMA